MSHKSELKVYIPPQPPMAQKLVPLRLLWLEALYPRLVRLLRETLSVGSSLHHHHHLTEHVRPLSETNSNAVSCTVLVSPTVGFHSQHPADNIYLPWLAWQQRAVHRCTTAIHIQNDGISRCSPDHDILPSRLLLSGN